MPPRSKHSAPRTHRFHGCYRKNIRQAAADDHDRNAGQRVKLLPQCRERLFQRGPGIEGQPDDEGCAFPEPVALGMDAAPVQLDQALDQGQAESQSSLAAVQSVIGLHEGLEQTRDRIRGHADAIVDHANDGLTCLCRDGNMRVPSARSELRCILQKVSDDLCDPSCVCIDEQRGRPKLA